MNPAVGRGVGRPKLNSLHAPLDYFGLEFLSSMTPTKAALESLSSLGQDSLRREQKQLYPDTSQPHMGPDVIPETHQGFLGIWIRSYPVGSFHLCVLPPQLSNEHSRALR